MTSPKRHQSGKRLSVKSLRKRASHMKVPGRSNMNRKELCKATHVTNCGKRKSPAKRRSRSPRRR